MNADGTESNESIRPVWGQAWRKKSVLKRENILGGVCCDSDLLLCGSVHFQKDGWEQMDNFIIEVKNAL